MDDRCYWIWLQSALGVQSRLEEAIAYFGTARRLYEAGELEWKLAGLFTARQLEKLRSQRLTQAEEILKQCAGNGWLALTPEDPCYPKRLRAIPNFPAALYVWGRMPDLDGRVALAVVGAREASFQGRQIAQGLCKAFAQAGAVVVSGGALGIDSAAHAKAVNYTMNRKAIRDLAAKELGLKTAKYFYAKSLEELKEAAEEIGFPSGMSKP